MYVLLCCCGGKVFCSYISLFCFINIMMSGCQWRFPSFLYRKYWDSRMQANAISNQVSHLTHKLTWCWRNNFCHILWAFWAAGWLSGYATPVTTFRRRNRAAEAFRETSLPGKWLSGKVTIRETTVSRRIVSAFFHWSQVEPRYNHCDTWRWLSFKAAVHYFVMTYIRLSNCLFVY